MQPPSSRPAISFLGAFSTSSSGISIGPARSDRIIVVAAQREDDTNTTCPLPTINGSASTVVYQASAQDNMCIGYAVVPTGTTVDIAGGQTRTAAWMITNVTSLLTTLTGSGTSTSISLNYDYPSSYCAVIGIARSRSSMGTSTMSATGTLASATKDTSTTSGSGNSGWVAGNASSQNSGTGVLSFGNSNNFSSGIAAAGVFV